MVFVFTQEEGLRLCVWESPEGTEVSSYCLGPGEALWSCGTERVFSGRCKAELSSMAWWAALVTVAPLVTLVSQLPLTVSCLFLFNFSDKSLDL